MKQLDATELQEVANIMAALGPDALAIIQWLNCVKDGPATRMQIMDGIYAMLDEMLNLTYGQVNDNVRELERLGILRTYYSTGHEYLVTINIDMPLPAYRLLRAVWPDLP